MNRIRHHPWITFLAVVLLAFFLVTGGFGIYLADEAGRLPWQTDPTRVSEGITPFAGIPGFSEPTAVPSTPTATPTPTY
jgi:hypothetical protein